MEMGGYKKLAQDVDWAAGLTTKVKLLPLSLSAKTVWQRAGAYTFAVNVVDCPKERVVIIVNVLSSYRLHFRKKHNR